MKLSITTKGKETIVDYGNFVLFISNPKRNEDFIEENTDAQTLINEIESYNKSRLVKIQGGSKDGFLSLL
ncbi:MAG: hypothetical protein WC979_05325 [Candidatus Pacearchaeota archaeon]|jgi:hypothetical protein